MSLILRPIDTVFHTSPVGRHVPQHPVVVKGQIWHQGRLVQGAVGFDPVSGIITGIGPDLEGAAVHDMGDAWVLPGGIDIHVHFRDPGHPHKEDFASGTRSALVGGTTTVFDMPNTDPATTTAEAYQAKREIARSKAHCDWGIYGGCTRPGDAFRALAPLVPGIKIYLGESTGCVTLEDPGLLPAVLDDLDATGFDGVLIFHAEAKHVLAEAGAAHREAPGLRGHAARRPVEGEAAAIEQIRSALDGRGPRYRIHIAHMSSPLLLEAVQQIGCSFGVTPNHLYLHNEMPLGARGRMNPPLRTPSEQAGLFTALAKGQIPIVESDHAPHTVAEKEQEVLHAPSGIPGVGTLRPLLVRSVVDGQLPLAHVMAATAEHPAELLRLPKGRLEPGLHADLAVYDPTVRTSIQAKSLESRAGWSPYEGHGAIFPTEVFLRGQHVVVGGKVTATAGTGREARPAEERA